jgi:hypothetical protein
VHSTEARPIANRKNAARGWEPKHSLGATIAETLGYFRVSLPHYL